MPVLLDTNIVFSLYDQDDTWHRPAVQLLHEEKGGLILPSPVIPEVDYFLGARLGVRAQIDFYTALNEGHYFVAELPPDSYSRVLELNRQFSDLRLGFVDAAIVAIAEALDLRRIATNDRRHFVPLAAALNLELLPASG